MTWITLALGVVVAGYLAIAVAAPHTPKLILEGYPALVWPTRGSFANVMGAPQNAAENSVITAKTPLPSSLTDTGGTSALLIYQRGQLMFEHYSNNFNGQTRFNSFSMVKSLVGILVLKAQAEGKIKSLNDPLGAYLVSGAAPELLATPLQAFLDMKSGLVMEPDAEEGMKPLEVSASKIYSRVFGDMAKLHANGLAPMLNDLRVKLGQADAFSYQNVNTAILGAVLEAVYRQPLQDILSEKIWRSAGAASAYWRMDNAATGVSAYCCLYARAADWLRVGVFLHRNGAPGDPFLPEPLWRRFMGDDLSDAQVRAGAYADHARHDVLDRPGEALQGRFVYFLGSGGQMTYIMPEKDLVVVRFAKRMTPLHSLLYNLARAGIIAN
ncbi:MAG: serine hydrolase [Chitinophagales bacterium]|nr:serine hydrolase [Hyphomicrobiales bacterium]